jgi:hypothetical protein
MLRFVLAALVSLPTLAWANNDHENVEVESERAFNAKANQCHAALGYPTASDKQKSDEVFNCANAVMTFAVQKQEKGFSLRANTAQIEAASGKQMVMGLNCRPGWTSVIFTMEDEGSIAEKLENDVILTYKVGNAQSKTERWRLVNGRAVATSGQAAKAFIDAVRAETAAEVLVKFATPARAVALQFPLENTLRYRELHLKYCS